VVVGAAAARTAMELFMCLGVLLMVLNDFLLLRLFLCIDFASSIVSKVKGVVSINNALYPGNYPLYPVIGEILLNFRVT